MASIERRVSKRGVVTWRVAWREGGRRTDPRDGETCDDYTTARQFAGMVAAAGERRPEGFPQGCHGLTPAAAEPLRATQDVPDGSAPSFGELVEQYITQLRRADDQQVAKYQRLFDQHVRTAVVTLLGGSKVGPLGGLPIDEITTEVIEAWVSWMCQRTYVFRKARRDKRGKVTRPADIRSYSAKTIHNIHGSVISPVLAYAARRGLIDTNPCAGVTLPTKPVRAVSLDEVPVGDEIAEWIEIGYKVSRLAGDMIAVAVGTGLRWSELIALRPCDIDLTARTLRVAQTVKLTKDGQPYLAPFGKSDSALRTIRISQEVCDALVVRCARPGRQDVLFQRESGGLLNSGTWSESTWARVRAEAAQRGITTKATLHKFRHSHAAMLLANNVSMDTVSKRLGHKSIVITTQLYSHLVPEADERAAEVIGALMSGKKASMLKTAA